MKIADLMQRVLPLAASVLLTISMGTANAEESSATDEMVSEQVLDYMLMYSEEDAMYEVWMIPSVTPKPDISLTGQVTIRVPHNSNFLVDDVQNYAGDAEWLESARTDAPEENPEYDYISFSYVGLTGTANFYGWEADKEQLIFSFRNPGGCVSDISLMHDDDPFNVPENSAGTRPGNQFTNIGWGTVESNNYRSSYGKAIICP